MGRTPPPVPPYKKHARGQGYCRLKGKNYYFGKYGTDDSRARYRKFLRSLEVRQEPLPLSSMPERIVSELIAQYLVFAERYYVDEDGSPTKELRGMEDALDFADAAFGDLRALEMGPRALIGLRDYLIGKDYARSQVNKTIGRIKRMFHWACENELCPPEIHHRLSCVLGLKAGRTTARESKKVAPVPWCDVAATIPWLTPVSAAMVQVQYLCGMRPTEVCIMRGIDIDRTQDVWFYMPPKHKMKWRGKKRIIAIPKAAQEILAPFLNRPNDAYLFSPREAAHAALNNPLRKAKRARKTKIYPSELRAREKRKAKRAKEPSKRIRQRYDADSYRQAIENGIRKAGRAGVVLKDWFPYQLRHSAATDVTSEQNIDAASAWLGHASLDMTEHYVQRVKNDLVPIAQRLDSYWEQKHQASHTQ